MPPDSTPIILIRFRGGERVPYGVTDQNRRRATHASRAVVSRSGAGLLGVDVGAGVRCSIRSLASRTSRACSVRPGLPEVASTTFSPRWRRASSRSASLRKVRSPAGRRRPRAPRSIGSGRRKPSRRRRWTSAGPALGAHPDRPVDVPGRDHDADLGERPLPRTRWRTSFQRCPTSPVRCQPKSGETHTPPPPFGRNLRLRVGGYQMDGVNQRSPPRPP